MLDGAQIFVPELFSERLFLQTERSGGERNPTAYGATKA